MPVVPGGNARSVKVNRQQDIFLRVPASGSTAAFGGSTAAAAGEAGGALAQAGDKFDRLALKQQAEDNERETKLLDIEFSEAIRLVGQGNGDNDPGYFSTRGNTAVSAGPEAKLRIEQAQKDIVANVQNPRVRQMFTDSALARAEREKLRIDAHTSEQRLSANKTASIARMSEAVEDGVAYNDDNILARSEAIIIGEIAAQQELEGWDADVTASKLEEGLTQLYRNAILTASTNFDNDKAEELFNRFGGKMDGTVRAEVRQYLDKASVLGEAQKIASAVVAAGMTETEGLAEARKEEDPRVQEKAVQLVKERFVESKRADTAQVKQYSKDLFAAIWAGVDIDTWGQENPEKFAVLAASGDLALAKFENAQKRRRLGELYADVSDGETYTKLNKLKTSELAALNLQEWQAQLTQREFGMLQNDVKAAGNSIDRALASNKGYATVNRAINHSAPEWMNIGVQKQTPEQGQMENRLRNQLNSFVESFAAEGKVPTEAEVTRELQVQTIRLHGDRPNDFGLSFGAFGDEFETIAADIANLDERQRAVVKIDPSTLPPDVLDQMKEAFRIHGIEPTPERLEEYAGAFFTGNRTRMKAVLPNTVQSESARRASERGR